LCTTARSDLGLLDAPMQVLHEFNCRPVAIGVVATKAQLEEIAAVSGLPPFSPDQMHRLEALWRADFKD
jgi:hypothetical protein